MTGQQDFSTPTAKVNAPNEATQAIPRTTEAYVTLDDVSAPLFKIGEKIRFGQTSKAERGGTILASTQKENSSTFVYDISFKPANAISTTTSKDVVEALITSSDRTVEDVVLVEVFGKKVRRTILKVLVSSNGVFTYDVGGGFEARNEDVLQIAGRRR